MSFSKWIVAMSLGLILPFAVMADENECQSSQSTETAESLFAIDEPGIVARCQYHHDCGTLERCVKGRCVRTNGDQTQCRYHHDCRINERCVRGECVTAGGNGTECRYSHDCKMFERCVRGRCVRGRCVR